MQQFDPLFATASSASTDTAATITTLWSTMNEKKTKKQTLPIPLRW
jgi:hypothetical protein